MLFLAVHYTLFIVDSLIHVDVSASKKEVRTRGLRGLDNGHGGLTNADATVDFLPENGKKCADEGGIKLETICRRPLCMNPVRYMVLNCDHISKHNARHHLCHMSTL